MKAGFDFPSQEKKEIFVQYCIQLQHQSDTWLLRWASSETECVDATDLRGWGGEHEDLV